MSCRLRVPLTNAVYVSRAYAPGRRGGKNTEKKNRLGWVQSRRVGISVLSTSCITSGALSPEGQKLGAKMLGRYHTSLPSDATLSMPCLFHPSIAR